MEISSVRLDVRELNIADIDDLKEMLQDPKVMEAWGKPFTEFEVFEWYEKQQKGYPETGFYALVEKKFRKVIGQAGLITQYVNDRFISEISLMIKPQFQNSGYGDEVIDLFCDYLKEKKIKEVCMIINEDNTKAVNLAKKHGFKVISKKIIKDEKKEHLQIIYAKDLNNRFNV